MARTRNIKPAFFDNDTLGSLDPLIRLLFIGLWCIADRDGRLEDRPRRIKKTLLGYDDTTVEETNGMLQQLADNGFIVRYTVEDEDYIQIVNFSKHQNPNMKEKASEIPPPPGFDAGSYKHHERPVQAPQANSEGSIPTQQRTGKGNKQAQDESESEKGLQEMRFSKFWEAYPVKKAKQDAYKAWKKIKPTAELFERIMTAVENYKNSLEWTKENGKYIPHPATWLNGGRWDDEITDIAEAPQPPQGKNNGKVDTMGVLQSIISEEEGGAYYDES